MNTKQKNQPIKIYGVKRKSLTLRRESQSGGAFSVIAEYVLKIGGIVYGCGFDTNLDVIYLRIDNMNDLKKIKGSKYVQAFLKDTFSNILDDLRQEKMVLFIGTACNVAGLKKLVMNVLGIDALDNLIIIDFICHGTPSQEIYREYRNFIEKKQHKKIVMFDFRKRYEGGWGVHIENIKFDDDTELDSRVYTDLFYSNFVLRSTCTNCQYTSFERCSDFTVGDFWGVEKNHPNFYDREGISLLFCNTDKSLEIFQNLYNEIEYVESTTEECFQTNMKRPSIIPKSRKKFWICLKKKGFEIALKKYTNYGGKWLFLKRRILRRFGQW